MQRFPNQSDFDFWYLCGRNFIAQSLTMSTVSDHNMWRCHERMASFDDARHQMMMMKLY